MGAPDRDLRTIEIYCERRVPKDLRDQIRVEPRRRGSSVTIVERRPPWHPDDQDREWSSVAVAQLRYDGVESSWRLYWSDSSRRWHPYEGVEPATEVAHLLTEIDADPTGIFWG